MFGKVLVANRGEIAGRVIRTLRRMGIVSVSVYSDPDRFSPPVLAADESVRLGGASPADSYLRIDAMVAACRQSGAQAVHPGYGFLSERPEFAEALAAAGIVFIGPRPEQMRRFGLKHTAREIARQAGAPLLPGSGLLDDADTAAAEAARIGYPVMLKSTAGGGGIGMQVCPDAITLRERFATVQRLAAGSFGDARVYLEKFVARARHIEVQIFGDGRGNVVALGERDCTLQRRNQKVIEETPAPGITDALRAELHATAVALGREVGYQSAGTVEFVYDVDTGMFYFLEVNTRLQVEHCVTEAVYGIDLVEWMVRQAAGDFSIPPIPAPNGAAIEARIYAENPARGFRPATGTVTELHYPNDVRVDGWIEAGVEVTPHYDPLLAKMIVHGASRDDARERLLAALDATRIGGVETNLAYLRAVAAAPEFATATMVTATLGGFAFAPLSLEVLAPGTQSTVQDWPGRIGYWDVGVPPSGPMDDLHFRRANRMVGNPEGAAGLELTHTGPTLRFDTDAVVALCGARMAITLDGAKAPHDTPFAVRAAQVLAIGGIEDAGNRAYLAIRNGIDAPLYLGSRACFVLGGFGGHATGALRTGDTIRINRDVATHPAAPPASAAPALTHDWTIGLSDGPHSTEEFFRPEDIDDLYSARYAVHFNSARTGTRLVGPKPRWARTDGGEAGLHPSNIHDNAYAVGAIDFTGDMPIILGPDGPSLGGFVCPGVIRKDELWKVGQLRPNDTVRFRRAQPDSPAIIAERAVSGRPRVVYRRAGDSNLLIEYGDIVLDLGLRLRVELLLGALRDAALPGVIDLTPGVRSLPVHYDEDTLRLSRLMAALERIEAELPASDDTVLPSRIVHMPLAWNDEDVQLAMRRYQELVRPDAPWCPSNIEFIRRINGLASVDDVRRIVYEASYLVLGLGDVYLGAPLATPLDPRHRLVTTKYNPARTWTPQNAVGIGGAYMCIYGMEGPGGYQLVGRTTQVWNSLRPRGVFRDDKPWLLRFFDQIRFFPVSHEELAEARAASPDGRSLVRIEPARFVWSEYKAFLEREQAGIAAFRATQRAAFEAERQDWIARGLDRFEVDGAAEDPLTADGLAEGCIAVDSPVPGSVWKIIAEPGVLLEAGDTVAIVESMKMEMGVVTQEAGRVVEILVPPGREVRSGQRLAILRREP